MRFLCYYLSDIYSGGRCHVCDQCDKTLILRNIGYECLNQFGLRRGRKKGREKGRDALYAGYNQFRNDHTPPPTPTFPARSFVNSVAQGGSAPRGQVQPLTPGRGTPLQTLFSLVLFVGLYSPGELASPGGVL